MSSAASKPTTTIDFCFTFSANFPEWKKHFHSEERISDDNWKWGWNCAAAAQKSVNARQSWCLNFNVREFFVEPHPLGFDVLAKKSDNQEIVGLGWKMHFTLLPAPFFRFCSFLWFSLLFTATQSIHFPTSDLSFTCRFSTEALMLKFSKGRRKGGELYCVHFVFIRHETDFY